MCNHRAQACAVRESGRARPYFCSVCGGLGPHGRPWKSSPWRGRLGVGFRRAFGPRSERGFASPLI
eukprot:11183960-Lingulodinium_polyedra.AAC.1